MLWSPRSERVGCATPLVLGHEDEALVVPSFRRGTCVVVLWLRTFVSCRQRSVLTFAAAGAGPVGSRPLAVRAVVGARGVEGLDWWMATSCRSCCRSRFHSGTRRGWQLRAVHAVDLAFAAGLDVDGNFVPFMLSIWPSRRDSTWMVPLV